MGNGDEREHLADGGVVQQYETETRPDPEPSGFGVQPGVESGRQPVHRESNFLSFGDAAEQDDELVPTQSSHGRARSRLRLQDATDPTEQRIARGVTEGVVDRLEVVEIEVDQRVTVAAAPVEHAGDPLGHAAPVRQSGEFVRCGLLPNLLQQTRPLQRAGGLVDSWGGGEFCNLFPRVLAFIRSTANPGHVE